MPSARYVHPEFGYFCPTPRFWRKLRVALACMVLGAIGVAWLRAGPDFSSAHSPASGSTAMMARVLSGAEIGPETGQASQAAALGLRPALSQSPKACEDNTWAYLDGKCAAGKAPKPRMVRVPTNRPAIAAIPLGRGGAPVAGAAEPASALVADGRKGDFSPSKPGRSAQAEPAATAVATEPSQQPVAMPKKSQRSAHSQSRRRDRDVRTTPAHGYASVPDQRYGPTSATARSEAVPSSSAKTARRPFDQHLSPSSDPCAARRRNRDGSVRLSMFVPVAIVPGVTQRQGDRYA